MWIYDAQLPGVHFADGVLLFLFSATAASAVFLSLFPGYLLRSTNIKPTELTKKTDR